MDKDHRQAKAAAKAVMGATTYPNFTPYEYPSNTAAYGFPTYSSQYFMYGAPMTAGMGWEFKDKFLFKFTSALLNIIINYCLRKGACAFRERLWALMGHSVALLGKTLHPYSVFLYPGVLKGHYDQILDIYVFTFSYSISLS